MADRTDPPPRLRRRPLLDGLRGVMVALTVTYHLESGSWLHGGWLGVSGFFVLSGFLITGLLLVEQEREGRIALARFYARRARRLAPALLVVVVGTVVAVEATGAALDRGRLRGDAWATLGYAANWRFVQTDQSYFSAFEPSPLRHTWSLAIEEQFYLVWPVLLGLLALRLGRRHLPYVLGLGAVASAWWAGHLAGSGAGIGRVYDGTDTRAQELLVGALAATVALRLGPPSAEAGGAARRRRWASLAGGAGLALFGAAAVVLRPTDPHTWTRGLVLLAAAAVAVVVVACTAADRGLLGVLLGNRLLQALGARAYVLYLVHWPVIVVLDAPRVAWPPLALDALRLAVTVAVAEVVHRAVELPFHRGTVRLPHPGRALAAATLAAALLVGATALVPQGDGPTSAPLAADAAVVTLPPAPPPERQRPGNDPTPAPPPRVVVLGDSQAYVLLRNAPSGAEVRVAGAHHGGCDILGEVVAAGEHLVPESDACPDRSGQWRRALAGGADAVVVTLGLRQLFDPIVDGERVEVGTERWEATYRAAVDAAVADIRAETDAPIVWLDVPCFRWYLTAGEERDPARLATVNGVLADQLATHPGVSVAPYASRVCTGDGSVPVEGLRPDGVHLSDQAAGEVWSWLLQTVGWIAAADAGLSGPQLDVAAAPR